MPCGKHALVGGGDVRVRAEHGGDAAVEIPAERDLLAGGLGVEVEQNDLGAGLFADFGEQIVGLAEGIVAGAHEDAALQIDDGVCGAVGKHALVDAEAGRSVRVVGRAKDAAAAHVGGFGDVDVLEDLFLVPDVIAGGDDVRAEVEELFSDGGCEAEAAGGVFAVDDEEIDGVGLKQVGQMLVHYVPAGGPENIAYKQNLHWTSLYGSFYAIRHFTCQYRAKMRRFAHFLVKKATELRFI